MIKVMVFIDGSWLYKGRGLLREKKGDPGLNIDYGKLPKVITERLSNQLGIREYDLVRIFIFNSLPDNVDPQDLSHVEDQKDFYDRLREDFHFETELFDIDFKRRRFFKKDRDPNDSFTPEEKCVDVALASSMLYYATIPNAYDAAIAVIGDEDYIPVLQYVRRLGKRVMIASIHGSCCEFYDPEKDPTDSRRIRDAETVFLDQVIEDIILERKEKKLTCQSPLHKGDREVLTDEQPTKGRAYYCAECRQAFYQRRTEIEAMLDREYPEELRAKVLEGYLIGRIKYLDQKGFGYIRSSEKKEYYFKARNLKGAFFSNLKETQEVQFIPNAEPSLENENTGNVTEIQPLKSE